MLKWAWRMEAVGLVSIDICLVFSLLTQPHLLYLVFRAGHPNAASRPPRDKPLPVYVRADGWFGLDDALLGWSMAHSPELRTELLENSTFPPLPAET